MKLIDLQGTIKKFAIVTKKGGETKNSVVEAEHITDLIQSISRQMKKETPPYTMKVNTNGKTKEISFYQDGIKRDYTVTIKPI
jgi:hypothetical protein